MSEQARYPEMDEQKVLEEYEKLHKDEIEKEFKQTDEQDHETPDAA